MNTELSERSAAQSLSDIDFKMSDIKEDEGETASTESSNFEGSETADLFAEAPEEQIKITSAHDNILPISRRDETIGQLRHDNQNLKLENESLLTKLKALEKPISQEPNEDDFDKYEDYLKAIAKHHAQNFDNNSEDKTQEEVNPDFIRQQALRDVQEQIYFEKRSKIIEEKAQEFVSNTPDYSQIIQENLDILHALPPQIQKVFWDTDNAPAAVYALAKQGKLGDLANKNPYQAGHAIAQAEIRGKDMISQSYVTNAPEPIQGIKAAGESQKSPDRFTADDIRRWLDT